MEELSESEGRTSPDMSGYVSIEEAVLLFEQGGVSRVARSVRRYCRNGVLDSIRTESPNNQEHYLIERASLERYITQLQHMNAGQVRPGPDESGHARPSPVLTGHAVTFELTDFLKEQVRRKDDQISLKDQQISALNRTLDQMIERDRETNVLLKGLQDQLFALPSPITPLAKPADTSGPVQGRGGESPEATPRDEPSALSTPDVA